MNRHLKQDLLNIPNILTYMRVLLIPVVIVLMYHNTKKSLFFAALVYSVAAITDFFDGFLARNLDMQSIFGKFLDPLADKIIVMSILIVLVELGRLPAWLVIILLTREMSITGLRALAAKEGLSIDVIQFGKWKTAFQMVGLLGMVIYHQYTMNYIFFQIKVNFFVVGLICIIISLFFSFLSAIFYFKSFLVAIDKKYRSRNETSSVE